MSREIENYVCASEDRPHYNNETEYLQGFYYPYIEYYNKEYNEENKNKGDTQ